MHRFLSMDEGDVCNASQMSCSVHTGTHVDAPLHFVSGGTDAEALSLDVLVGPCEVVEVNPRDGRRITAQDIESSSLGVGTERLLLKTSNSQQWEGNQAFFEDFIALSADGAATLVSRGVALVGIDYLSIQSFDDPAPEVHQILLEAGVVIVEGLDLRNVEPGRYQLVCLPLKLKGSDGAPARAILIRS
jgi:arylformamidase